MDLTVLRKKISSYRTPTGRITSLPDEDGHEFTEFVLRVKLSKVGQL